MPTTNNMGIVVPVVGETVDPQWAEELNAGIEVIDQHDHTNGKGVKVTPDGLNINNDLTFQSNNAEEVRSTRYDDQIATLTDPEDIRNVYVVNGDLYYNNGGGIAVQITDGTSVSSSNDGISRSFETTSENTNTTILPADTFSYLEIDTTASVTVTLPPANSVAHGRFYAIADVTGNAGTNNIVVDGDGTEEIDGQTTFNVNSDYGSAIFASNGTDAWKVVASYGSIPAGTKLPFYQAAAPVGWTLDTSVNDRFIRISNSAGGTTSGSFSNLSHDHNADNGLTSSINTSTISNDDSSISGVQYYVRDDDGVSKNNHHFSIDSGVNDYEGQHIHDMPSLSHTHNIDANTISHGSSQHAYANFIICTKD